jgi:small subunit ribosomal protein S4
MKIGPKYKKARRLGNAVFEKTQTAKYSLNEQKKMKNQRFSRPKSTYGKQLIEKQKVRFTYLLTEKQFRKYINQVIEGGSRKQSEELYQLLESRADNVVLRSGFLKTRPLAKQAVSHGHFTINGKRVNVPSIQLKKGDKIEVRESSKTKVLFADLENNVKENITPSWMKINVKDFSIEITGEPTYNKTETHFDLAQVLEFYKR